MSKDLYAVLGVRKNASVTTIKTAYRELSKMHHPDKNGGKNDGKMEDIVLAYEVLSNSDRRKRYDETGMYEAVVGSVEKEAITLISSGVESITEKYGEWIPYVDFKKMLIDDLTEAIESTAKEYAESKRSHTQIMRTATSVRRNDDGDNVLATMVNNSANRITEKLMAMERFLSVSSKAVEILEKHEYKPLKMSESQQEEFDEKFNKKSGGLDDLLGSLLMAKLGGKGRR